MQLATRNNLHARHTPRDHDNRVFTKVFVWRLQDGMYGTGLLFDVPIGVCLCMYLGMLLLDYDSFIPNSSP